MMELIKKVEKHLQKHEKLKAEVNAELSKLKKDHAKELEVIRSINKEREERRVKAKRLAEKLIKDPLDGEVLKELQDLKQLVLHDREKELKDADDASKKIEQVCIDLEALLRKL